MSRHEVFSGPAQPVEIEALPGPAGDPILAAMAAFRAADATYLDLEEKGRRGRGRKKVASMEERIDAAFIARMKAMDEVYLAEPTTHSGLIQQIDLFLEHDVDILRRPDADGAHHGVLAILRHARRLALERAAEESDGPPATLEQIAALEFEPVRGEGDGHKLPSPNEWLDDLVTLRIAYHMVFRTKEQLVDLADGVGGEKAEGVASDITNLGERLRGYADLMSSAEVRFMSALAVVELRGR